jgi:hypothetical protein
MECPSKYRSNLTAMVEAEKHDRSILWTHSYKVRCGKTAIFAAVLVQRFNEREEPVVLVL